MGTEGNWVVFNNTPYLGRKARRLGDVFVKGLGMAANTGF